MPVEMSVRWAVNFLAPRNEGAAAFDAVRAAYAVPERFYHTLDHVDACLRDADRNLRAAKQPADPEAVFAALVWHDAVYVAGASDNGERSADLAAYTLRGWGRSEAFVQRVRDLILATKHAAPPTSFEAQVVVDADLAELGAGWGTFWTNWRRIREEFAHVPGDAFNVGRARFLKGRFLDAPRIYHTEYGARREAQARANIEEAVRVYLKEAEA